MVDTTRIALVMGGNKGIGLAIARQLAQAEALIADCFPHREAEAISRFNNGTEDCEHPPLVTVIRIGEASGRNGPYHDREA